MTFEWEPAYGPSMRGPKSEAKRAELAAALEVVRRRVCGYGSVGDQTCDCKYGASPAVRRRSGSEATGCPELRETIHELLHGSTS